MRCWTSDTAQMENIPAASWHPQKAASNTRYRPITPTGSRNASPAGSRHSPAAATSQCIRPGRSLPASRPTAALPAMAATPMALSAAPYSRAESPSTVRTR